MAEKISKLHEQFLKYAQGMPALAVSWGQINADLKDLAGILQGQFPDKPHSYLRNVPLGQHGLCYSVFVNKLEITPAGNQANLNLEINATVHIKDNPRKYIKSYNIIVDPNKLVPLQLDSSDGEIFWQTQGTADVIIDKGDFNPDYETILKETKIPEPQEDNYEKMIDYPLKWLTRPSVVRLVVDILPRYKYKEIAPWINLSPPIKGDFGFGYDHIVITSDKQAMEVGDCFPRTIPVEPDPNIPPVDKIPGHTYNSHFVDYAVYSPKAHLKQFFFSHFPDDIPLSNRGGGVIKWKFNLSDSNYKSSEIKIITGKNKDGIIRIEAEIDVTALVAAWITGPCGSKLSYLTGLLVGNGPLTALVIIEVDTNTWEIKSSMTVTLKIPIANIDWIHKIGWPLDSIADILKLAIQLAASIEIPRSIARYGQLQLLNLPMDYIKSIGKHQKPVAYIEGLNDISAVVGVMIRGDKDKSEDRVKL